MGSDMSTGYPLRCVVRAVCDGFVGYVKPNGRWTHEMLEAAQMPLGDALILARNARRKESEAVQIRIVAVPA